MFAAVALNFQRVSTWAKMGKSFWIIIVLLA